jgi:hypothetical protein
MAWTTIVMVPLMMALWILHAVLVHAKLLRRDAWEESLVHVCR